MLWASLGGGLARVNNTSQISGQPEVKQSGWAPMGTAALSLGANALGGYPFVELRASLVADPNIRSLTGSFTPISFQLGYRFDAF